MIETILGYLVAGLIFGLFAVVVLIFLIDVFAVGVKTGDVPWEDE